MSTNEIIFDEGRHHRARLGFVLLAMEQTVEGDLFQLAPPGVGVHFARAPMANRISVDTLSAMATGIGDAAAQILPDLDLDTICYACTSGSVVIGEERVFAELNRGAPGAQPTSLITSVMQALATINAQRIAVATPYLDEVNAIEHRYLQDHGFTVTNIQGLRLENDADMARVAPSHLIDFAKEVDRSDAEALFISCSALRTLDIIDTLESALGKPVITSNQAMMWHCLRLAGISDQLENRGALFKVN
ncbi:hypothetical protein [Streptomyces sp. NPDC046805]|uniref:maleate cis-trans isomerase family protein n=1 Tax=Streptomyces sp. NPDC046805 TaxID=3155134 RepID=UPI0033EFE829